MESKIDTLSIVRAFFFGKMEIFRIILGKTMPNLFSKLRETPLMDILSHNIKLPAAVKGQGYFVEPVFCGKPVKS